MSKRSRLDTATFCSRRKREERNDVVSDEDSEVFVRGGNDSISINSDGWTFGMKFDFAGGFGGIFDNIHI